MTVRASLKSTLVSLVILELVSGVNALADVNDNPISLDSSDSSDSGSASQNGMSQAMDSMNTLMDAQSTVDSLPGKSPPSKGVAGAGGAKGAGELGKGAGSRNLLGGAKGGATGSAASGAGKGSGGLTRGAGSRNVLKGSPPPTKEKPNKGNSCMTVVMTTMQIIQRSLSLKGQVDSRNMSCKTIKALKKIVGPSPVPVLQVTGPANFAASQAQPSGGDTSAGVPSSPGQIVNQIAGMGPGFNMAGITESSLSQMATQNERFAMATTGGPSAMLHTLPDPGEFVDKSITTGPAAAIAGIIPPQTGAIGAAINAMASTAESNQVNVDFGGGEGGEDFGDSGGDMGVVGDAENSLSGGPIAGMAPGDEITPDGAYAMGRRPKAQGNPVDDGFGFDFNTLLSQLQSGGREPASGVPRTGMMTFGKKGPAGPDVFHQNTSQNIFEIISIRTKAITPRVE